MAVSPFLQRLFVFIILLGIPFSSAGAESGYHEFYLGQMATDEEVRSWDIDVGPGGAGLPEGSGTVSDGAKVYARHCASCHGTMGLEGPMPKLVGGQGTLASSQPVKTIGSYWSYATTLFDYINRAMPFTAPQSLAPNDIYAVVAWLLFRNGLIDENTVMNKETLPQVRMLRQSGFVSDPRPDVKQPKP